MKTFAIPYGKTDIQFQLPSTLLVDLIEPGTSTPLSDPAAAFQSAYIHPLGKRKLTNFPFDSTVGIAINDKTRPLPQPNPLAFLLTALSEAGFSRQKIKLFIGSGTHTPMEEEDLLKILDPGIINQHPIIYHDCNSSPMVSLGKTGYNLSLIHI